MFALSTIGFLVFGWIPDSFELLILYCLILHAFYTQL